ncbi:MAG: hypothetical protein EPN21_16635 [Methylococcaceae bacterium]|nr:MAG: hypothetical protein EPN21_16635 [Methylococcaceae bacterium]
MTADPSSTRDTASPYACDLCRLPVEVSGFELMTVTGVKRFCCEGCVGVYQMLNGDTLVEDKDGQLSEA